MDFNTNDVIAYYTSNSNQGDLSSRIAQFKSTKPQILADLQSKIIENNAKYDQKIKDKQLLLVDRIADIEASIAQHRYQLKTEVANHLSTATIEYNSNMMEYRSSGKEKYRIKAIEKQNKYNLKAQECKSKYEAKIKELKSKLAEKTSDINSTIRTYTLERNSKLAEINSKIANIDSFIELKVKEMIDEHNDRITFIMSSASKYIILLSENNGFKTYYKFPKLGGFIVKNNKVYCKFMGQITELSSFTPIQKDRELLDSNCEFVDYSQLRNYIFVSNNLFGGNSSIQIGNQSAYVSSDGNITIGRGSIINGKVQNPIARIENEYTYFF
jgi:hypoxanthine phosphoribosyltransferase